MQSGRAARVPLSWQMDVPGEFGKTIQNLANTTCSVILCAQLHPTQSNLSWIVYTV